MPQVVRPWFGRALTVIIAVVCAAMTVSVGAVGAWWDALRLAPWTALVALACWATFWRPHVAVSDAGVSIVNVTRTIDVPWPALRALETKWALTLVTAYGRFTAWSAPAPGARSAMRSVMIANRARVPLSAPKGPAVDLAPGELADTGSGDAAALVRLRWDALRRAGHLDDPKLERDRAAIAWHLGTGAAAMSLVAVGVVLLVV